MTATSRSSCYLGCVFINVLRMCTIYLPKLGGKKTLTRVTSYPIDSGPEHPWGPQRLQKLSLIGSVWYQKMAQACFWGCSERWSQWGVNERSYFQL